MLDGETPQQKPDALQLWAERYILEKPLGEGGMAIVWRAWDRRLKAWRAIKILRTRYSKPTKLRNRFELEAQSMASLSHAHIVTVHDIGEQNGQLFIVMEWLAGGSLHDRLQRGGPLPARMAVSVITDILLALHAAHEAGIVHRDVKPSNILLDTDGRAVLTDFGVARVGDIDKGLTRTGVTMGTIGFMAPEQREDARSADIRADLYAIGATLWTLLSGRGPLLFVAPESRKTLDRHVIRPIADIIWRATRYNPDDRYEDALTMRRVLLNCIEQLPIDPPDTLSLAEPVELPEPPKLENLSSWNSANDSSTDTSEQTWTPGAAPFTIQPEASEKAHKTIIAPETLLPHQHDETDSPAEAEPHHKEPQTARNLPFLLFLLIALVAVAGLSTEFIDMLPGNESSTHTRPDTPTEDSITGTPDAPSEDSITEAPDAPTEDNTPDAPGEDDGQRPAVEPDEGEQEEIPEVTITETPPAPAPRPAQVIVKGDAAGARLIAGNGTTYTPGRVPPGHYVFEIVLPTRQQYIRIELGELRSGDVVTLKCADDFGICNKL